MNIQNENKISSYSPNWRISRNCSPDLASNPFVFSRKINKIWIVSNGSAIGSVCARQTCFYRPHIQIYYITGLSSFVFTHLYVPTFDAYLQVDWSCEGGSDVNQKTKFKFVNNFSENSFNNPNFLNNCICLRSHDSRFQHHTITSNHFTVCCVSSDTNMCIKNPTVRWYTTMTTKFPE